jgi:hypothetical protein
MSHSSVALQDILSMKLICLAHSELCESNETFTEKIKLQLSEEWNQSGANMHYYEAKETN